MRMNTTFWMSFVTPGSPVLSRVIAPIYDLRERALKNRTTFGKFSAQGARVPGGLIVVVAWSTIGLVLTGLLASFGFSEQIGQFLAVAG
jgi:hypothetical protein